MRYTLRNVPGRLDLLLRERARQEGKSLNQEGVATLFRQLREQGKPIPTNDVWIAALVLQHNLLLRARDAHFARLPQLTMV
jgi:predicted nucleic acid-binding protein